MHYIHRNLAVSFLEADKLFPVLLLTGARQVGKSTFLHHLASSDRRIVTLDDLELRIQAQEDPKLFLMNHPALLLIDEVQYAPQLFPYIKIKVDEARRESPEKANGLYWLTGTAIQNDEGITESLAGRVGIFKCRGFPGRMTVGLKSRFVGLVFRPGCKHCRPMNSICASGEAVFPRRKNLPTSNCRPFTAPMSRRTSNVMSVTSRKSPTQNPSIAFFRRLPAGRGNC